MMTFGLRGGYIVHETYGNHSVVNGRYTCCLC